jgi:hypothetical protein
MHIARALALLAPMSLAAGGGPLRTPISVPPAARDRQTFEDWSISYELPAGWQVAQRMGRVHGLTTGSQDGVIYVAPGVYQNFNEVAVDLGKGFQALGITGMPMGQPTSSTLRGMQAMTANYTGQTQQGMPLQARVTALLTPHGTGLVVTGIASAQRMADVGTAVDQIAQSIDASGPPRTNAQAVAALRGRWMFYAGKAEGVTSVTGGSSRSYEEFVEFDGQGRFSWQSSGSVSVTAPGTAGSAGGAQASSDDGSYTVIGSTLVLRGRQGQSAFDVQILPDRIVADGRTYVRTN